MWPLRGVPNSMGLVVQAGLFSGTQNPHVELTEEESSEVLRRIALLFQPGRMPTSSFGYYGMYVQGSVEALTSADAMLGWGTIHAYGGSVRVWGPYAHEADVFVDTAELEVYLRECFMRHAAGGDRESLRALLTAEVNR
jgi:hypothetical protein